jgi:hypothetical protein
MGHIHDVLRGRAGTPDIKAGELGRELRHSVAG